MGAEASGEVEPASEVGAESGLGPRRHVFQETGWGVRAAVEYASVRVEVENAGKCRGARRRALQHVADGGGSGGGGRLKHLGGGAAAGSRNMSQRGLGTFHLQLTIFFSCFTGADLSLLYTLGRA